MKSPGKHQKGPPPQCDKKNHQGTKMAENRGRGALQPLLAGTSPSFKCPVACPVLFQINICIAVKTHFTLFTTSWQGRRRHKCISNSLSNYSKKAGLRAQRSQHKYRENKKSAHQSIYHRSGAGLVKRQVANRQCIEHPQNRRLKKNTIFLTERKNFVIPEKFCTATVFLKLLRYSVTKGRVGP